MKLAFRMFLRSKKQFCFVVVQLCLLLCVCIAAASYVYGRLQFFLPVRSLFTQEGAVLNFPKDFAARSDAMPYRFDYRHCAPFDEDFPDYRRSCYNRFLPEILNDSQNLTVISYSPQVLDIYCPKLVSGSWNSVLTGKPQDENTLPAVLFQRTVQYRIGEMIEAEAITYENERKAVRFAVTGLLDGETLIWGNDKQSGLPEHFMQLYQAAEETAKPDSPYLLLVSQEAVDSLDIVSFWTSASGIMTFPQGTTETDAVLSRSLLVSKYRADSLDLQSFRNKSLLHLRSQLLILVPICAVLWILAIVSSICTIAVLIRTDRRHYALFRICGATKFKCIGIFVLQSVLTASISLLFTVLIMIALSQTRKIAVTVKPIVIVICSAVVLTHLFVALLLSAKIIQTSKIPWNEKDY